MIPVYALHDIHSVSYTHLDVYKRQAVSTTVSVSAINLFFIIIVLHVYILPLIIYVFAKLVNPALTSVSYTHL